MIRIIHDTSCSLLILFCSKNPPKGHTLWEEIRLNRNFYLFSTRSPSCLWSLNSQSTIVLAWIVAPFFLLKKQKTKSLHWITKNLTDFIIAVTGIRIKSELAGVVLLRTYSCFESLRWETRRGSNRCPVIAFIKESVRIRSNPKLSPSSF